MEKGDKQLNVLLKKLIQNQPFQKKMQQAEQQYDRNKRQLIKNTMDLDSLNMINKYNRSKSEGSSLTSIYFFFEDQKASQAHIECQIALKIPKPNGNQYVLIYVPSKIGQRPIKFDLFKLVLTNLPFQYLQYLSSIIVIYKQPSLSWGQTIKQNIFSYTKQFYQDTIKSYINSRVCFVDDLTQISKKLNINSTNMKLFANHQPIKKTLSEYPINQQGIPIFLYELIQYYKNNPSKLQIEGIFRKNSVEQEQKQLMKKLANKIVKLNEVQDPHLVASLIRRFFRDLETPIIPFQSFQEIIQQITVNNIKNTLLCLEKINKQTLKYLIIFLVEEVVQKQKFNKMSNSNIAKCFAPNLMWLEVPSQKQFNSIKILELILQNYREIFIIKKPTQIKKQNKQILIKVEKKEKEILHNITTSIILLKEEDDFYQILQQGSKHQN